MSKLPLDEFQDLNSDPRDHIELCPKGAVIVGEIAERIEKDGGFGLLVDYGHLGENTDTLIIIMLTRIV